MDIKIITIHAMHNPGSVLQAYALHFFLNRNGANSSIIDYRPSYFYKESKSFKFFIKKFVFFKYYMSRNNKFNYFIKQNMVLTEPYYSYNELRKSKLDGDVFLVGSDQLWNSDYKCGNDMAFYLGFVRNRKKVSYSTSVGKLLIDDHNLKILKENLTQFDFLSVREKSTSEFLTRQLQRKVRFVCDPVFLLDMQLYKKFIAKNSPHNKPYIMVYLAPNSTLLDSVVEGYRKKGYDIFLVGGFSKRCFCDKHIKDTGPEDFLTYIYYAEVIISTSFHATAFAHIFHKKFWVILPKSNGERISSLLEVTGLNSRVLDKEVVMDDLDKNIVWSNVDLRVKGYKDSSIEYLLHSCGLIREDIL